MKTLQTIIISFLVIYSSLAQDGQLIGEEIQARKIAFITEQLDLSPDEAKLFWPVYDEHHDQLTDLRKQYPSSRKMALQSANDTEATQMIQDYLTREQRQVEIKQSMVNDLDGILSPVKIAKLLNLEAEFKRKLLRAMRDRRGRLRR